MITIIVSTLADILNTTLLKQLFLPPLKHADFPELAQNVNWNTAAITTIIPGNYSHRLDTGLRVLYAC